MQSRAAMAAELAEVQSEIVALRRELGLPAPPRRSLAQAPLAAANLLPRTLTEEGRQVQAALVMSARSAAAAAGAPAPSGPPGRIKIKRQVSGIDGMRTMAPQNPQSRPVEVAEHEDEEGGDDEDWAPLTRQVSGRRGMTSVGQMDASGGPARSSLPPATDMLPRTLTEEERQIQTALAMSARSAAAAAGAPGPPGRVTIKRQVSGIDGVRTMAPPNPRRRPEGDAAVHKAAVEEVEEHEDEEGGEDEDWAPLTRQVSGRRGMQMASFHR